MLGRQRPNDPSRAVVAAETRLTAWAHGHVQGVGFRWSTRAQALERGLVGFAKNYPDGRVLVIAEGAQSACESLLAWLNGPDTPGRVDTVVSSFSAPHGDYESFACK